MGNTPPPEVLNHVIALCTARGIVGAVVVPDHDSSESGPHLAAYFACGGIPTSVIELSEWTESKDLAGASVSERAAALSSRGGVKNWLKLRKKAQTKNKIAEYTREIESNDVSIDSDFEALGVEHWIKTTS
jgi:hypothetical protein